MPYGLYLIRSRVQHIRADRWSRNLSLRHRMLAALSTPARRLTVKAAFHAARSYITTAVHTKKGNVVQKYHTRLPSLDDEANEASTNRVNLPPHNRLGLRPRRRLFHDDENMGGKRIASIGEDILGEWKVGPLDEVGHVEWHLVNLGVAANVRKIGGLDANDSLEGLNFSQHFNVFGGDKVDSNSANR